MADAVKEVLEYWLDEVGPQGWYVASDQIDAEIERRFGALWEQADAGALADWMETADGALALLILLDQFSRNLHRGTPQAFASDAYALGLANRAIDAGLDMQIPEPQRQFFYLPLMHSEVLADQERCLELFRARCPETGAENLKHGAQHRDVIARFGRFPSRNAILGRDDTEEEKAYRAEGGYMS